MAPPRARRCATRCGAPGYGARSTDAGVGMLKGGSRGRQAFATQKPAIRKHAPESVASPSGRPEFGVVAELPALSICRLEAREELLRKLREYGDDPALSDFTCPICFEPFWQPVRTICGHAFCEACLLKAVLAQLGQEQPEVSCPLCRHPLHVDDVAADQALLTRIRCVLTELRRCREEEEAAGDKTLRRRGGRVCRGLVASAAAPRFSWGAGGQAAPATAGRLRPATAPIPDPGLVVVAAFGAVGSSSSTATPSNEAPSLRGQALSPRTGRHCAAARQAGPARPHSSGASTCRTSYSARISSRSASRGASGATAATAWAVVPAAGGAYVADFAFADRYRRLLADTA